MAERDLDVVVLGASGITGRRVAAHLAEQRAEDGPRWAAAGRDPARVESVLAGIGVSAPETIVADVGDPASLVAMASRTRVVANLVGPYTLHGRPVIEACVAAGAHYLDLTGEIPFMRSVIDDYDARAVEAGVKVVQPCGFEALPPDLAVLLAAEAARERHGEELAEAELEVRAKAPPGMPRPSDVLSGGTLQSMAEIAAGDDTTTVTDPAALVVDPAVAAEVRRRSPITVAPRRGSRGSVVAPMAPAAYINPAVIHRTALLVAAASGAEPSPFRYREGVALGGGDASLPLRYAAAGALSGAQVAMAAVTRARPDFRRWIGRGMRRVLPSSGFGPSGDRLEAWSWRMSVSARTTGGHDIGVEVDADGHPGYLATARMVGEAALLLAGAGPTPERGGCLTPAAALGTASIERFDRARVRFRVDGPAQ